MDVLKGKVKVQLVKFVKENKKAKRVTKTQLVQDELFEKLRHWRLTTAKSRGVPAYAVFSDATLKEIVDMKPNYPYLYKNLKGRYKRILKPPADFFYLHNDGWLEIDGIPIRFRVPASKR